MPLTKHRHNALDLQPQFIHAIHGDLVSVNSFNKVQFVLFIFDGSIDNAYSCVNEKLAMI